MRRSVTLSALLLTLLLWPTASLADAPYAPDTRLSVIPLTDAQQALVDTLYPAILACTPQITLPKDTRYEDVAPAMDALMRDYPELFHLGFAYNVGYLHHRPDVATYITPQYRMTLAESHRVREELYAVARDLAVRYPDPQQLHDALVARVTYGGENDLRHTAVGALLYGTATCEGYANALTLLYRMLGIPCGMVTGNAVNANGETEHHAWNIADLGGPTLIDATWNDQEGLALNTCWYYGLSTAQMAADHVPDAGLAVPLCGDQANWHRLRGLYVADQEDAYAAIYYLVRTGEPLNIRITDASLFRAMAQDTYAYLGQYNADVVQEDGFYGGYSVVTSQAQGCMILRRTE